MEPIPTSIQAALDLFDTALADVRFADIDAETLARAAAEVQAVATVVVAAQAALDSARRALQERQDSLFEQVQRAMAYARVYAESDEALTERLNAIPIPRSTRSTRAKEDAGLILSAAPQRAARQGGRPRRAPFSQPLPDAELQAGSVTTPEGGDDAASVGS